MLRPILLSALGGLAAVSPNSSARAQDVASVKVTYADLDLATPAGLHTLDHRISWAVSAVCGDADIRDLDSLSRVKSCRATAIAGTQVQIAAIVADRQHQLGSRDEAGVIEMARSR